MQVHTGLWWLLLADAPSGVTVLLPEGPPTSPVGRSPVVKSCCFPVSENIFILLLLLKDSFTRNRTLGWHGLYFLQCVNNFSSLSRLPCLSCETCFPALCFCGFFITGLEQPQCGAAFFVFVLRSAALCFHHICNLLTAFLSLSPPSPDSRRDPSCMWLLLQEAAHYSVLFFSVLRIDFPLRALLRIVFLSLSSAHQTQSCRQKSSLCLIQYFSF